MKQKAWRVWFRRPVLMFLWGFQTKTAKQVCELTRKCGHRCWTPHVSEPCCTKTAIHKRYDTILSILTRHLLAPGGTFRDCLSPVLVQLCSHCKKKTKLTRYEWMIWDHVSAPDCKCCVHICQCETEAKGKRPLVLEESVLVQVSFKFPQPGSGISNNVLDRLPVKISFDWKNFN